MEAKAVAKYVRMSSSKLKPVTDLVRGKDLNEALTILKFTPGKGSELVEKVVKSAAANAENNHDMNLDELYVAEINANQGPTMKRWRPGAQGRAGMILKRTSNIYVTLKEKEAPVKAAPKAAEPKEETDKEEVR
jgi:large subunit ribosomal protein L22